MKVLIYVEDKTIKIENETFELLNALSYDQGILSVSNDQNSAILKDYDISISIYHTEPLETFFKVRISNSTEKISDTEYCSDLENLNGVVNDIIYLIFNYRKLMLSELFTNNTYIIYYYQKFNLFIEADIKIVTSEGQNEVILTDEHARCYINNDLKELIKNNILILRSKSKTYKLLNHGDEYYIDFSDSSVRTETIDYLNEAILKEEFTRFLSTFNFDTKPLLYAINNIKFEQTINDNYNVWLKNLHKNKISTADMLKMCCNIRHLNDHRQIYYKKLVSVYERMVATDLKKKKNQKGIHIINNNPPGTLKDYFNKEKN